MVIIDSPSPMNGEIVEVEGGHIVRSTGTKDRHSKVCTAKGPRDRRVRLSAPTAIQFYDVQDRLGFDRPSKAVDWLINKAKSAIDDLEKLPPWNPIDTLHQHASNSKPRRSKTKISSSPVTTAAETEDLETEHQDSSLVPASMVFPVVSTELTPPCRNYHQSQDLRLSLQSFANQTEQPALFSNQSDFDQRLMTWNNGGGDGGGFVFASPATNSASFQPVYGQSQVFSQRGPLQSINTPMIRAWFDPQQHHHHHTIDDHHHHNPYHVPSAIHQSAIPGIAFASNGEFAGFRIPARFQGEHEEHHGDNNNNKPSSASSDSRH